MQFTYSIVIPHYNSANLLSRMLKSIPERDDIQIIVVDDKSKTEEVEKLKQLQHKNLEIYYQSENKGAGAARNVGLDHVKAKWVDVVDADDMFSPDAFDVFDQYKDSDYDYISFRVECFDKDMKPNGAIPRSEAAVRAYSECVNQKTTNLIKYMNQVCRNKLVSYDFIQRFNIRCEESPVNNDVWYGLQIGHYGSNFKVIPNILYYLIEASDSITHRKRSIEREYLFFLQAQKRNGLFDRLGLKCSPYYRRTILYLPYMIKKRGIMDTFRFFKYVYEHKEEVAKVRNIYSLK